MIEFVFTPGFGVVAILTLFPKLPLMLIVKLMTGVTIVGQFFLISVFPVLMALIAADSFMRASQLEFGIFVMIEAILRPSIGRMAFLTILSEPAVVLIVGFVAGITFFGSGKIAFLWMAVAALHAFMLAN